MKATQGGGGIKLAGRFVLPKSCCVSRDRQAGDQYSQGSCGREQAMRELLSEAGFGFANVVTVPTQPNGEVSISF